MSGGRAALPPDEMADRPDGSPNSHHHGTSAGILRHVTPTPAQRTLILAAPAVPRPARELRDTRSRKARSYRRPLRGHRLANRVVRVATSGSGEVSDRPSPFPSPRKLRRVLAFVADWSIHFRCAWAILGFPIRTPALPHLFILYWIVAWLAASFTHRVVVQVIVAATIGKALVALRSSRRRTGGNCVQGRWRRPG